MNAAFESGPVDGVTRWVERTWLALGGAACAAGVADLEHVDSVLARLQELERTGLPDPADLEHSFDDLFAASGTDAAVEIMTIHKSKGLEFDMVVVPALERHISTHGDPLLLSHQFARAERDGLIMAARPGIGAERDDLFEFLRHQARDAASLEAERLLYVACTRAKHRLYLTATIAARDAAAEDADEPDTRFTPRAGSLLGVLWPVSGAEFLDATSATMSASAPAPVPRGHALHRVPAEWSPALDTILAGTDVSPTVVVRDASPVFDWAGETARRVGLLVHAELQTMDLDLLDPAAIRGRQSHFRRWLGLHGVPPDRLDEAAQRVVSALLAVHSDARARWILKRWDRGDFREYALSGRWRGEVTRVVFDRSFVDDAGVRWVIDYKTSQHGGGDLEEFLDREVERYRPQLHRYAEFAARMGPEPVRVGLYFPLMRAWRDWAP